MSVWVTVAMAISAGIVFITGLLLFIKYQAKNHYQQENTWAQHQQRWQTQYQQRQGPLWKVIRGFQWYGFALIAISVASLAYLLWVKPVGFDSSQSLALANLPTQTAVITQRSKILLSCRRNNHCAYQISAENNGRLVLHDYWLGRDAQSSPGTTLQYVTLNGQNHVVSEPLFDLRDEVKVYTYSFLLGIALIFGLAFLMRWAYWWFIR